jgi:1-acyl-sn-glycerol-3-phosphate acyltransferase
MQRLGWALRSALYVLWLLVTVVPYAIVVLTASLFMRGPALWWVMVVWLMN